MSRRQPVSKPNRDPNNINEHLTIAVDHVLGEPVAVHSIDMVWDFSTSMYTCCQQCWYGIFTLLCGCCIAAFWGIQFGLLAFEHIWCLTPCLKVCELATMCFRICYEQCLGCCVVPLTRSCGGIFVVFHTDIEEKPVEKKVKKAPPVKKTLATQQTTKEPSFFIPDQHTQNAQRSISRQLGLFMTPTKSNKVNDSFF